jgi:hypothetical protein
MPRPRANHQLLLLAESSGFSLSSEAVSLRTLCSKKA